MTPMDLWFTEKQTAGVGITCKVLRTLHSETTPFQKLDVIETEEFGRMLVLDGMVQTTERDEFVYHEMMAHVAMQTHPDPRRVAVVGGGDGGVVREVLKYASVREVKLIEIDERVVAASREYFKTISSGLDDPRVECLYADGILHIKDSQDAYDVVLIDSTEPVGPAIGLFEESFYRSVFNSLTAEGVMVAQTESPFFNREILSKAYGGVRKVFPVSRLFLASIPTYPSGLWSFSLGSKARDPLAAKVDLTDIETNYYTAAIHQSAFALPRFVERLVAAESESRNELARSE